jgi:hypothetical protein
MVVEELQPKKTEEEAQDFGHINIRFVQQGSIFFDFDAGGIVPMQMIAIGEYLLTMGKSALLNEQRQQQVEMQKSQIEVPRGNISPEALNRVMKKP